MKIKKTKGIVKQLYKELKKVKSYKEAMAALSDEELKAKTVEFRQRFEAGESLDKMLPEAFAAMCEADMRVLHMFPFDVQILAGIALHLGYLAEMNTGEGKTLTATCPMYLNGLTGKGAILVTNNEYLALRDAEEMGPAYEFMGLTISAGVKRDADDKFENDEKKEIYNSDIVYTTHSALGFDYLINNLVKSADERFMRDFYYIIIDEADSVLLDSASTPLVISGAPRVQSNLYDMADFFVRTLQEDVDYEVEEKNVWFTEKGLEYAESYFGIENIFSPEYFEIYRHLVLALRAHKIIEKGTEYMISETGEVALIDASSGRMLKGVKLRGGQHQALECKEKVEITQENRSMASITYQNFFSMFPKMAGMSGTIYDARDELYDVYGKKVVVIPTNNPIQRVDCPDWFFSDSEKQFEAAIKLAVKKHETGQPVLIVTTMISDTEIISHLLVKEGLAHSVLNANNAFWEAEIIKEAGQMGAMTVATSMAGRGTDIKLGPGVKELGGLAVIGVGRMLNIRDERQARGRAGRQGDPGYSRFLVSLEDDIVEKGTDPEKLKKYIDGSKRISDRRIKKIVNGAQRTNEEMGITNRKNSKDYDVVLQLERKLMYDTRDMLLDGGTVEKEKLMSIAGENIDEFLRENKKLDVSTLNRYLLDNISYRMEKESSLINLSNRARVKAYILARVERSLEEKKEAIGSENGMNDFIRVSALSAIDEAWIEQVDYLQQLQGAVSGRSSAQRNLMFEYQGEALESFRKMESRIKRNIIRNVLLSEVSMDKKNKLRIILP
ncbi:preprotein translocase subunit SecA [Pseudobutyrivibrio sp. 49]|uniref:accessory Sec system translocase SecA2 n=1 Tax=unclassified Pseudobutyrivibrio TaxID=2638619 RepID=UPI00088034A3|nr:MULTISPECIES: accessory Sec system translocase SecA2 [unclassified Pseudobutyrivibrio]SDH26776.1 preprotein translocase subunit SecA [Pseudobutyrivibrio sp. 49]SFO16880.1 preprotein translocase subunit SecA [Pseudobutyrivibrio sp. UC1225]